MEEKQIIADKNLIAYCGLYCGACRSYLKGKCSGCAKNEKASWCKIRQCCIENKYQSCADCKQMPLEDCKKFNSFIGKIFGLLFNSNRAACINTIKEKGSDKYAEEMAQNKKQSLPRK